MDGSDGSAMRTRETHGRIGSKLVSPILRTLELAFRSVASDSTFQPRYGEDRLTPYHLRPLNALQLEMSTRFHYVEEIVSSLEPSLQPFPPLQRRETSGFSRTRHVN